MTKARLLPTNMQAMKSCGLLERAAMILPRTEVCALSSVCNRLEDTKAISIPEKKADARSERERIRIELEGSGSMKEK